jgi:hypothetical protein
MDGVGIRDVEKYRCRRKKRGVYQNKHVIYYWVVAARRPDEILGH